MISDRGLELIKQFEGCRLEAYPDPGTGGKPWTIGYGHTHGVHQGQKCTQEEADAWLRQDAQEACMQVLRAIKVRLTQNQLDALTSFVFNVGIGNFKSSTLLKRLNDGDFEGAGKELLRWTKAAGKVLPGLVRRREAEKQLFEEPMPLPALALPLAAAVIDIFTPLAKEKINKELARHSDNPEVVEKMTNAVIQTVQQVTGQTDPIQAVAEFQKAPELIQQVESQTLASIDQVLAVYREVRQMDREDISAAREHDKGSTEFWKRPAFWITLLLLPLVYFVVYRVLEKDAFSPEVQSMVISAVITGILGAILGYWLGSSFGSQEKTRELVKK